MAVDRLDAWLQRHAGDPRDIKLGLDRVAAVYASLGKPVVAEHVIVVGGTNGKGSSIAMLEAIYESAGYRTGAYTSPHLHEYRERVRLRGAPVAEEEMLAALESVEANRDDTPLTYFEFGTLAALWLFAQQPLDLALLEVGLGGRLDAVNLIDADVALVTNVALDHQDWLGSDREAIGREKAGIFRPGRAAICGESAPPRSLIEVANELGADLRCAGRDFSGRSRDGVWDWLGRDSTRKALPLPALRGVHQLQNAAAVLAVVEALQERYWR
jgi:dihydrofolate synthase/folylpolyglutamate synthase